ncbi:ABC transporter permease [Pseudomonas sp. 5P_3.1_Bac2]|uniref:ABC transporter permease n=1 Tax=Pseudomonas sp. 5P_3.1_Bac2 TaxID=2971617 RepID=UPI0021CA2660|nr:ABC transporter permease [Pseudomonas sp. 5P_3.1_Bac2]MCU1718339.1 ABC transporter permease [Pseudomonas sp. 5P_3.1_Bac2]
MLLRRGSLGMFFLIMLGFTLSAPNFLTLSNIANVFSQTAILGVLALGLTCVIIAGGSSVLAGGLDLSLAANLGLCAALFSRLNNAAVALDISVLLTLGCGLAAGLLNGLAVLLLRLPPLLATLASMNVLAGLELVLSENTVIATASPLLEWLSEGFYLAVPVLSWVLLLSAAVLTLLVQYSAYGLRLYAVGEHPQAAEAAGIRVPFYVLSSYLLAGLCAALAALCSVAFFSGSTTGSSEMLLSVVATAFLGVVFSRRLVASIPGTLLASLLIGFLGNGFQLLNLSSFWLNGVQGLLILLVVAASSALTRGGAR